MLCETCNQNVATVRLTEIVGKKKKDIHLCDACAKSGQETGAGGGAASIAKGQFSVSDILGGIVGAQAGERPVETQKAACPECGLTYAEFRTNGRFGCPADYQVFHKGIIPLLEKIHSATQHTGKVPLKVGQRIVQEKTLLDLKRALEKAVEHEDFERAAQVRDEIRKTQESIDGDR